MAIAVIAVALAAALYVHQRGVPILAKRTVDCGTLTSPSAYGKCLAAGALGSPETEIYVAGTRRATWEDPVAILLAIGGLAIATAALTVRRHPRL